MNASRSGPAVGGAAAGVVGVGGCASCHARMKVRDTGEGGGKANGLLSASTGADTGAVRGNESSGTVIESSRRFGASA